MALVGISKTDTFEHVSDQDPCKRQVDEVARKDPEDPDSPMINTGKKIEVIDDGATVFKLGVLDVFLMGMIYDRSTTMRRTVDDTGEVSLSTAVNATNIECVRYGLRGWEHFPDEKGNDIPFVTEERLLGGRKYQAVTHACLNALGIRLISELADKIKTASEVTRAEAKN